MRLLLLVVVLVGLFSSSSRGSSHMDEPPVFDKRPFAEARKAAEAEQKWFIVKATAVWCGPCKRMDQTTWRDEKVVKWLQDHAVVVAVDVDQEKKLAAELRIQAMPTMVAFKAGKDEFDRVVGYKGPEEFLVWLQGIEKGEKAIEAVRQRARPGAGGEDVQARMDLARSLATDGKDAEAADEYVWLWNNMLDHNPAMSGVRVSFMAADMERLAAGSEAAKKKFVALRDEAGDRLKAEKVDREDLSDWLVLNRIVGERQRSIEWFDTIKDEPRWRPMLQSNVMQFEEPLREAGRWADLGRLYQDPMRDLAFRHRVLGMTPEHELPEGLPKAQQVQIRDIPRRLFREGAGNVYAALLAADREEEAAAYAEEARRLDAGPKMLAQLVQTALKAGEPRKDHLSWTAEDGSKLPESLRKQLEAALREKP
jgi:thioredoxin 1